MVHWRTGTLYDLGYWRAGDFVEQGTVLNRVHWRAGDRLWKETLEEGSLWLTGCTVEQGAASVGQEMG